MIEIPFIMSGFQACSRVWLRSWLRLWRIFCGGRGDSRKESIQKITPLL